MKNIVFIFLLILAHKQYSQSVISLPDTLNTTSIKDSALDAAWNEYEEQFRKWFLKDYSVKEKIKISCGGCSSFRVNLILQMNDTNSFDVKQVLESYFCGQAITPKRIAALKKGISKVKASPILKGKVLIYNFSRALKC